MSAEDDDVVIDFSKIKGIFRRKRKPQSDGDRSDEREDKEDERSDEREDKDDERRDEEFDVQGYWQALKGFSKKYSVVLLLLIPIILSIFLRAMPIYLPVTDQWARDTVVNNLKSQIATQVNQQYPNLPAANKNQLINQQINDYIQNSPNEYNMAIEQASEYFKTQMQMNNGQTYLLAIDPYYWIFFANNILENGHVGNELRDGKPWTTYQQAPQGVPVQAEFHMYMDAWFYKFISFFNKDTDLWTTTFYIPIILATLGVIPAFFIAKKRGGNIAGVVAGIFVAIHPAFLSRTAGGFSDTDAYNVVLPLYVMWFFLEALESRDLKKSALFVFLSTITLALFKFAWSGWWYVFDFILAASVVYIGFIVVGNFRLIRKNFAKFLTIRNVRHTLATVGMFIAMSLAILPWFGRQGFRSIRDALFGMPQSIVTLKDVATTQIWPNVLTTVAELNPSSIPETISGIGGRLLFIVALLGIILSLCTFLKKDIPQKQRTHEIIFASITTFFYLYLISNASRFKDVTFLIMLMLPIVARFLMILFSRIGEIDIKYATILIIWFVGTIFGSTRGVRFVMLLVPAFSIAIGLFVGIIYRIIIKLSKEHLKLNEWISAPVVIFIIYILIFAQPWQNAVATGMNEVPSMNDAWWNGLEAIKLDSREDAIITSWWDFGHWFRAIADRGVTFDGASQSTPQAHWVGKSLLTEDEDMAVGILRMLDCSRNDAYTTMTTDFELPPLEALRILDRILVVHDAQEARLILEEENLTSEQIDTLLPLTHCEPPEAYYITSEDMIGKAAVWGHFGSWDFRKAEMVTKVKRQGVSAAEGTQILMDEYGLSSDRASSMYYEILNTDANQWISPWPGYVSGITNCALQGNDTHVCSIGVQGGRILFRFNETEGEGYIDTPNGVARPNSFTYFDENGEFVIKRYSQNTVGYSFTLLKNGNRYSTVMMHPLQAGSMFTRLFFHEGQGLEYFDKLYDARGITGGRVLIWKVDWDGKEPVPEEPETEVTEVTETDTEQTPETNESEETLLNSEEFPESNETEQESMDNNSGEE